MSAKLAGVEVAFQIFDLELDAFCLELEKIRPGFGVPPSDVNTTNEDEEMEGFSLELLFS